MSSIQIQNEETLHLLKRTPDTMRYGVTAPPDVEDLLLSFDINDIDLENIHSFGKIARPKIDDFITDFYVWLETRPEYDQFFSDATLLKRVQSAQKKYWHHFFQAEVSSNDLVGRQSVAEAHVKIQLPLEPYLAGMNFALTWFCELLQSWKTSPQRKTKTLRSLTKYFFFNSALICDAYHRYDVQTIEQQSRSLIELSTPALKMCDEIVLMPLIGVVDTARAATVLEALLNAIVKHQARVAILDVTGVPTIDTRVSQHLMKAVAAAKMLGAKVVITGFSPAAAETLTKIDVDLSEILTCGTLQSGFVEALRQAGKKIVDRE